MAAMDYFLKIDGIRGESQDDKHKGEIEVISFSWNVAREQERARVADFKIVKTVDTASPLLVQSAIQCTRLRTALFVGRTAGGKPLEYLKLTLNGVLVTSVSPTSGSAGERPLETVSLGFESGTLQVAAQKPDGSLDAFVTTTIDPSTGQCDDKKDH
jgi:type VI secretion system secreted protein Hcp